MEEAIENKEAIKAILAMFIFVFLILLLESIKKQIDDNE